MSGTVRAKGLEELKTVTTHHVSSKPPRKGTTYLDLFTLSMERQRLEQELAGIERRRKRISNRLAEVQRAMEKLTNEVREGKAIQGSSANPAPAVSLSAKTEPEERQWKKMTVNY